MSRATTTARVLVASLVAAAGLAACSNGSDSEGEAAPETTTASAQAGGDSSGSGNEPNADEGDASGDPEANGAAEAGIDVANPPDPIGEVTVPINEDGISETKVEVLEAKERGKVLLVTLRFTPEGTTSDDVSIFAALGSNSFAPALIDLKNLKKYEHVKELTTNTVAAKVTMGESVYGFTAFPLPPDELDTIDLKVSELAPPIEDLPLP